MPPSTRSSVSVHAAVGLHRLEHVAGLVGDRFERGAGDLGPAAAARQAQDRAAGVRVPVGRAQADEGRHHVDAAGALHRGGQRLGLGGAVDDPQAVAQPLHRRARDEDRAFQAVGDLAVQAPADRGQQVVLARHGGFSPVFISMKQPVP